MTIAYRYRHIFLRAIILSCLIHASILGLFVFTLKTRSSIKKPPLLFLGSILREHDLTIKEEGTVSFLGANAASSLRLIPILRAPQPETLIISEKKEFGTSSAEYQDKQFLKHPTEKEEFEDLLSAQEQQKAASRSTIPPREPLTLNPND